MTQSSEMWALVPGFTGYEVSDQGRVRSWRNGNGKPVPRTLKGGLDTRGYRQVCMVTDTGQTTRAIHRLVAAAFLGPEPEPPTGCLRIEVCHRNGDRLDNRATNLRYGTPKQNTADSIAHGTHTSLRQKAKTQCKHGHEFTPENTAYDKTGDGVVIRRCRACSARRSRESAARKRGVGAAA